jgi:hypothetical protein
MEPDREVTPFSDTGFERIVAATPMREQSERVARSSPAPSIRGMVRDVTALVI